MCLIFKLVVETTQCDIIVLQLWVNDQSTKYWPLHHFNPSSLIYVIKLPTLFTRWFGKYIYCSICRWKRLAMSVFSDYCSRLFFIPFLFFFFCNYLKVLADRWDWLAHFSAVWLLTKVATSFLLSLTHSFWFNFIFFLLILRRKLPIDKDAHL